MDGCNFPRLAFTTKCVVPLFFTRVGLYAECLAKLVVVTEALTACTLEKSWSGTQDEFG